MRRRAKLLKIHQSSQAYEAHKIEWSSGNIDARGNLDCIGGGGTQYKWVNEGLNKYCVDVLGPGWRDVEPKWCGTQPSGVNACCGFGIGG